MGLVSNEWKLTDTDEHTNRYKHIDTFRGYGPAS